MFTDLKTWVFCANAVEANTDILALMQPLIKLHKSVWMSGGSSLNHMAGVYAKLFCVKLLKHNIHDLL